MLDYSWI